MDVSLSFLMSETNLFQTLSPEEFAVLEKKMFPQDLAMGATLYKQGDHAHSAAFLVSGKLSVIKGGKEVGVLKPGNAVGELALLDGVVRSATIQAVTKSTVVVLKREAFEALLKENPQIGIKLLKELARNTSLLLRKTTDDLSRATMA